MEEANRAVRALDLPFEVSEFLEKSWGISNLHPPQHEAMPSVLSQDPILCSQFQLQAVSRLLLTLGL